jgi:hypothetical protein
VPLGGHLSMSGDIFGVTGEWESATGIHEPRSELLLTILQCAGQPATIPNINSAPLRSLDLSKSPDFADWGN